MNKDGAFAGRGCEGKKRYPNEREAGETAQHQMQLAKDRGDQLRLNVYRCSSRSCGGWHLTEVWDT